MPVDAIVGACWGDEGKGKFTDYLASRARWVARFQGGRNAGHTIVNPFGRFALHLLPSGVFTPGVANVLGPGVALDIPALGVELAMLADAGVPKPTLYVSERCQVVLPFHALLDRCEERRLGDRRFGSTQVGIAPFYADKVMKRGVQVADLFDEERLAGRIAALLEVDNVLLEHLYGEPPLHVEDILVAAPAAGRATSRRSSATRASCWQQPRPAANASWRKGSSARCAIRITVCIRTPPPPRPWPATRA